MWQAIDVDNTFGVAAQFAEKQSTDSEFCCLLRHTRDWYGARIPLSYSCRPDFLRNDRGIESRDCSSNQLVNPKRTAFLGLVIPACGMDSDLEASDRKIVTTSHGQVIAKMAMFISRTAFLVRGLMPSILDWVRVLSDFRSRSRKGSSVASRPGFRGRLESPPGFGLPLSHRPSMSPPTSAPELGGQPPISQAKSARSATARLGDKRRLVDDLAQLLDRARIADSSDR